MPRETVSALKQELEKILSAKVGLSDCRLRQWRRLSAVPIVYLAACHEHITNTERTEIMEWFEKESEAR